MPAYIVTLFAISKIVTLFAISKIASLSVISKSAFPRIEFPRLKIAEPELAQGRAAPSILRSIFALFQYHYLSLALLSCLLSLFPCF